jgi:hypothetical protein
MLKVCDLKVIKAYVELEEELGNFNESFDKDEIVNM